MAELETNVQAETTVGTGANTPETVDTENVESTDSAAEIARLKAELAKQKAATDKATKEAGDFRKQLRAKQSAEEVAAEEKREADEAMQKELNELRKRFAVAETSKKVFGFVGDEEVANNVAEYLYGAEDVDAAVDAFNKAWIAREKKLRLEYGKIPAPGIGKGDGLTITKEQLDALKYTERLKFATEHPEEYNALMGRK